MIINVLDENKNAARYANVSVGTLHIWLKICRLKYFKLRGLVIIKMTDMYSIKKFHNKYDIGELAHIIDKHHKKVIEKQEV